MSINKYISVFIVSFTFLFLNGIEQISAQQMTTVSGRVFDKRTKEPLPFVNIVFDGKNIGTISDYDGYYVLKSQWASEHVRTVYLGYEDQVKQIKIGKNQSVNFYLKSKNYDLDEVQVVAKKQRYRNKNNPAVELIRKVSANRDKNRLESFQFYEYDKYEKVEFDLNNISEDFRKRKSMKKFQYVFQYVDTSEINGKPFLPLFLKETISKIYYRQSPESTKEYVSGNKMVGFSDYIDSEGVQFFLQHFYQDIDVYNNYIDLMTNQFTSPIAAIAPQIYKFRIIDTLDVNGYNCIRIGFQPRNKADFAFAGNLYVTNDTNYSLVKIKMRVSPEINLNFVNDLEIEQSYTKNKSGGWIKTNDRLVVDYNIGERGIGMYGKRNVITSNYTFNKPREKSIYRGSQNVINEIGYKDRDQEYWSKKRPVELNKQESNIYVMADSIQKIPAFKRTIDIAMLLAIGYWNFDKIDVGPVNTFYSFNDIEGFRARIGARTSDKFSKKIRLDGYLLYGFKDERFKYSVSSTFSLNNRPLKDRPTHNLQLMYQYETRFPGMQLMFINEDNFLLSFKRGIADKIIYYEMYRVKHEKDWGNGLSTTLLLKNTTEEAGGSLKYKFSDDSSKKYIITSEIGLSIRFAPNEIYYSGMNYKIPVLNKFPIMQLTYNHGFKGVFKGDYNYDKLQFNLFKRFYLGPLGYTETEIEAGKIFGSVPFPLMFIHRANQTYSYQLRSYNMMNFLEFVSDEYASVYAEHHFNGFILNKIPLIKKLQWRSIVSCKMIFGKVTDKNNPSVTDGLMLFPTDDAGNTTTFILNDGPYIEGSIGLGNIFKFFRVDLVRRFTYMYNPNVPEYGIRARFKFEF